jgi:hypothetical protein
MREKPRTQAGRDLVFQEQHRAFPFWEAGDIRERVIAVEREAADSQAVRLREALERLANHSRAAARAALKEQP